MQLPFQNESSTSTTKNSVDHLFKQMFQLKYKQKSIQQRNLFLQNQLRKQKERSTQLIQQVQDLNTLNYKSKQYYLSQIQKIKTKSQVDTSALRNNLEEQMKQRLNQKDTLIKQIRTNNQQSQDFLRKRINSYQTQYKKLQDNYAQLKQLFDEYQFKSQNQKSKLLNKIKYYQEDTKAQTLRTNRKLSSQKSNNKDCNKNRYDSLKHQYSNLLQKSAKSQRRMTKINNEIEDITRQYSKKLFNKKLGYRLDQDIYNNNNNKRVGDNVQTSKHHSMSRYESFNNFSSLSHSKINNSQQTRRSPLRSIPNTNNKQNNSFFSNVNIVTNFCEQQDNPRIQVEVIRPSMPHSDKLQTNKKKMLQHLVIGNQRDNLKPTLGFLQVQTPCFESRGNKGQIPRVKKINLKSRK